MKVFNLVSKYISSGKERSVKAKKNILYSIGIKIFNIIINLLYVPLLIGYLGTEEYGIWLILTSIIGWFSFFDIGIGNGLRNKFAEAKAQGNVELARTYLSTAYATITIIFLLVGFIVTIIIPFIDWNLIFNTSTVSNKNLVYLVLIVFVFFILRFITQLISVVLFADQKPALASSFNLASNIVIIILILITKQFFTSSLILLGTILSGIPVLVFIVASIYFYKKDYYNYRPAKSYINFGYAKPLLNLGLKFFVIQVAVIVMHSATNVIIAQFYSPHEVTLYNIGYRYFFVIQMFWGIVLAPFWSATTEAYINGDFVWIKNTIKKLRYLAIGSAFIIIIMLLLTPDIYDLWIRKKLNIPFSLSVSLAIYSLIFVFFAPYISFLNGVGKIKLSTYIVVLQSIIFIPVVLLFVKVLAFGVPGIIYAGIVCEIPLRVTQPIQYYKLINRKAQGIWNQ